MRPLFCIFGRCASGLLTAGIPISTSELDAKVWLLNCENGTIDLRTDELRKHRRGDLVTRMAPVKDDSEVEAPEFAMFLERILPSEALRRLGKRAIGYSATGEYARQAAPDLLLIKHNSHPTELANLFGARSLR